jgi:hypothetical protein
MDGTGKIAGEKGSGLSDECGFVHAEGGDSKKL